MFIEKYIFCQGLFDQHLLLDIEIGAAITAMVHKMQKIPNLRESLYGSKLVQPLVTWCTCVTAFGPVDSMVEPS